eukprot:gene2128-13075_t
MIIEKLQKSGNEPDSLTNLRTGELNVVSNLNIYALLPGHGTTKRKTRRNKNTDDYTVDFDIETETSRIMDVLIEDMDKSLPKQRGFKTAPQ